MTALEAFSEIQWMERELRGPLPVSDRDRAFVARRTAELWRVIADHKAREEAEAADQRARNAAAAWGGK